MYKLDVVSGITLPVQQCNGINGLLSWNFVHPSCLSCVYRFTTDVLGRFKLTKVCSRLAPNQWETSLQSKAVSHWLGANPRTVLNVIGCQRRYHRIALLGGDNGPSHWKPRVVVMPVLSSLTAPEVVASSDVSNDKIFIVRTFSNEKLQKVTRNGNLVYKNDFRNNPLLKGEYPSRVRNERSCLTSRDCKRCVLWSWHHSI